MTLFEALRYECPVGRVGERLVREMLEWHTRAVAILEDPQACGIAFVQDALVRSHDLLIRLEEEQVT